MSGTRPIAVVAGLLLFGVAIRNAAPQSLVPAGSINDAVGRPGAVIVTQADPAIEKFVETIQKRFFPKSRVRQDSDTPEADLAGVDLIVYGTPKHAWLARHAAKLPFRFGEGTLEIDGRRFAGEHLRVICAMKSPSDPSRRALVYAAAKADDVVGINGVFHGPTEWVVADGTKSLGAGSFTSAAISVDDLRSDLDTLVAALRDVHPATVEGLPPDVQRAVDATREALREPMTRTAAWRALSRVLVEMHDAHSVLWPPASGDRLALSFVWLEGGLVVSTDEGDLKRGDRILAINGNDEARLTAALRSIVSTENANWLHARGEDVLCDLGTLRVLGLATEFPVPLRIERGGATIDVKVGRSIAGARPHPSEPWVRFAIDKEHGLGVFTLDRCVVDAQYQETLARFFRVVEEQGIGRIAVDVRANGGGDSSVVDEFLRYVDVDGYVNFGGDVRFSSAVALKHWGRSSGVEHSVPGRRDNRRRSDVPLYRGKLDVLTGPHTFSSGNWFAVIVHDNKLGRIIGEPTGNAPSSYGDIVSFTLPKSGLSFTLSYKRWIRPDPSLDPVDALVPDVLVVRTREHVRDGADPVLDYVRNETSKVAVPR